MKAPLAEDTPSTSSSGGVDNCGNLADLAFPSHLKQPLWDKANKLASDDSAIVSAPGDEDGWMVKSSSGKRPHYVKMSKCTPNFTVLSEAGKPKSTGKKSARKGVSKKTLKEISTIVREAEMSSAEWEYRGDAVEPSECALDTASQGDTASTLATAYPGSTQTSPISAYLGTTPASTTATTAYVGSTPTTPISAYLGTTPTSTSPTTAYLVNNRDMHIGSIGSVH